MTLKSYFWGMRIALLLSFAVWIVILFQINPETSGAFGKILFYAATFLFVAGFMNLFLTWIRKKTSRDPEMVLGHLGISLRQAILLALLVVALLVMQSFRILTWWDSMLTVAGILLIELYFLTRK